MRDAEPSTWTGLWASIWAGVAVLGTAAGAIAFKFRRGLRADTRADGRADRADVRADFKVITDRLDRELADARVQINALWARVAQLQYDHASCESERNRLTAENVKKQHEIDEMRMRLAEVENK